MPGSEEDDYDRLIVRAELRRLDSADAVAGLETFRPDDQASFRLQVGAVIGPEGERGEEIFYFTVCTPAWLAENPPPKGFEFLRLLLLPSWDYNVLVRAISDLCRRTEGRDWNEIATTLSRYGSWEFEDYRETG